MFVVEWLCACVCACRVVCGRVCCVCVVHCALCVCTGSTAVSGCVWLWGVVVVCGSVVAPLCLYVCCACLSVYGRAYVGWVVCVRSCDCVAAPSSVLMYECVGVCMFQCAYVRWPACVV